MALSAEPRIGERYQLRGSVWHVSPLPALASVRITGQRRKLLLCWHPLRRPTPFRSNDLL